MRVVSSMRLDEFYINRYGRRTLAIDVWHNSQVQVTTQQYNMCIYYHNIYSR